ncbi:MAG: tetratricopeptide repeat protein [Vicinamibacterales bacterium]
MLGVEPDGPPGTGGLAASLSVVPATSVIANAVDSIVAGEVNAIGTLITRTEQRIRGDGEVLFRAALRGLEPADRIEAVSKGMAEKAGQTVLADFEVRNVDVTNEPLVVAYQGRQAGVLDWTQPKSSLKTFLPKTELLASDAQAWQGAATVQIGSKGQSSMSAEIVLPAGYRVRPPVNVSLSRGYGSYESRYEVVEGRVRVARTIRLNADVIPASRSADYLAFVAAIRKDEEQTFAVEATPPAQIPATPPGSTDFEIYAAGTSAYRAKRYADAAALYQQIVDRTPTHPDAWNALGLSLWLDKRLPQAADAMRKQIALNSPLRSSRRLPTSVRRVRTTSAVWRSRS